MIRHPVFFRKIGKRTLVMTIIDSDMVKDLPDPDSFIMAKSERNIYNKDQLVITCDGIKLSSKKYAEICSKNCGYEIEDTIGNSIGGIATSMYWFIQKTKSVIEMMGGK